jgi:hypothetical protein
VDKVSSKTCLISDLTRELADFRIAASPLNPEFHFVDRLSEVNECRVVKANERRRLYHLQTPDGGYFLKCSALVRTKDRLRHFILFRRRWAEWLNLHRLRHSQIPAARPLAKGQSINTDPKAYFVLTEQVPGTHIPINWSWF